MTKRAITLRRDEKRYVVLIDGEPVGRVEKVRLTYDANHLSGGPRGRARNVTATVWQAHDANHRHVTRGIRCGARRDAVAALLTETLTGCSWVEAEELARAATNAPKEG